MEIEREEYLIRKVQSGNIDCFEELYSLYKDLVYSVCLRFLNDQDEADDASQDVFVKVYCSIGSFRFDSKFSTYIYRIAVNHCLNIIRKKRRTKFLSLDSILNKFINSSGADIKDESMDLENILNNKERSDIIERALNSLPERQKTAIVLSKFEGLSYLEIANIMDCSISSVESLLFRAKQNLSIKLNKYFKK
jgi:RNA polymerase sigma-70 factor, ECF subfamily